MASCSSCLLVLVNVLTFFLSIPILLAGIWLAKSGGTECEKLMQTPILVLGGFIMIISLVGLIGTCCRSPGMRCLYLFMMFLLIVVLVFQTMFTYAVTNLEAGEASTTKGKKEHGYSMWLKQRLYEEKNWIKIKSCLANSEICTQMADKYGGGTAEKSHGNSLSSVQSGCCKPSNDCKFTYIQQTIWNKTNGDFTNPDCLIWDNKPDTLCYNCNSCKAGLLDEIKADWKRTAKINIAVLVLLIIIYIIGCCSYANSNSGGNMNSTAAYRQNHYAPQNPNYPQNPYQNNPHAQNYGQNPYANNPAAYKQMNP